MRLVDRLLRDPREKCVFKKADFNQFRDLLAVIPWNCCSGGSVDEDWVKFRDLLLSLQKKRHAFKLAKPSQKDKDFRKYRDISNRVRDLTR